MNNVCRGARGHCVRSRTRPVASKISDARRTRIAEHNPLSVKINVNFFNLIDTIAETLCHNIADTPRSKIVLNTIIQISKETNMGCDMDVPMFCYNIHDNIINVIGIRRTKNIVTDIYNTILGRRSTMSNRYL